MVFFNYAVKCQTNSTPTLQKPHQKSISKSLTPTTFLPLWTTIVDDNIVKDENQQNVSQCKI
jgi:hypothetical protein